MVKLIGNAGNQVPTNNMLGNMAFQNKEGVAVDLLGLAAGTAAAPSLTRSGDTNTGVWFPAADTIAMSTNGSEKMRLTSGGELLVGTTANGNSAKFLVSGPITVSQIEGTDSSTRRAALLFSNLGGNWTIEHSNDLTIKNVLPGDPITTGSFATFGRTSGDLLLGTNGAERMRITSAGNVGVGVTPSAWGTAVFSALQIRGGSIYSDIRSAQYGNTNIGANVYFDGTNSRYIANNAAGQYSIIANSGGTHAWYNSAAGTAGNVISFTQAMTLDASGNLRVGTTSDVNIGLTNRVHISAPNSNTGYGVAVTADSSNRGLAIFSQGFNSTTNTGTAMLFSSTNEIVATESGTSVSSNLKLNPNGGNVGIGASTFGTSASRVLAIGNGTAPTTGPSDTIQIYSSDLSAGNTMLSIYTEGTTVNANTTAATTHRIAIRVNGTIYYLLANTSA